MRVLVCGGRNFSNVSFIYKMLDRFHEQFPIHIVIEGDAKGVDKIAGRWARENNIADLKFPADWKTYGKSAGYMRNSEMLYKGRPNIIIAFPGGKGTEMMKRLADEKGIEVVEVYEDG